MQWEANMFEVPSRKHQSEGNTKIEKTHTFDKNKVGTTYTAYSTNMVK